ncbi:hypothetical protein GCM10009037_27320 [Halarchaeum grantii]|uniref:Cupin type-2 domain-containing protein n=1 Tax=Halarchaeum grantii TaxID=1193105 RepID=A0A830FDA0_9EURY|nr:cupin domain-containing protein [Halarchaeum grantii]GGL42316.1 hypothetical protein GCM10009037_27320 [Halarchaeum grantii]
MPDVQTLADLTEEPHATVFADAPRTVRLSLDAGESLPEHDHPGVDVLLVGLEGHLTVELDGDPHDVRGGDVLRVAGEHRIEPRARDDSTALVVLAPREGDDA